MIRAMFETDVQASLSAIWEHFINEDLRKQWETDLESIIFDGPVATGTSGTMQLSGMPPLRFVLSKVETNHEFADEVDIPDMGTLEFKHEMFSSKSANYVRQTVTLTPGLRHTGGKEHQFFRAVTKDMSDAVFRLKTVVENYSN